LFVEVDASIMVLAMFQGSALAFPVLEVMLSRNKGHIEINPLSFINELKRRHVFRVAGIYAVAGWLLMQLATHFEDSLNLPGWVDTFVTLAVLMGFPVAMVLAWMFDLTPEGLKKTGEGPGGEQRAVNGNRRPQIVLLSLLVVIVGYLAWQFSRPGSPPEESAQVLSADEKSIAILPFIPLSSNENDGYFGKGMAEELLNALTKFPELKVAARTSAFSFEGQNVDLREVGKKLGVAHVLEGSVRSAGDRVRVTAQLIRAEDGFHLWSESYDKTMSDLFVVQDEIVAAINRTLQIHLGVGLGAIRAERKQVDPLAYQNYLRGLELWGTRANVDNRRGAIRAFQLVTTQDQGFADGWAAYGVSLAYSEPEMSGMGRQQHFAVANKALEQALAIDPDNVRALSGLSVALLQSNQDLKRSRELAERAVQIAPNASLAHYALAWAYEVYAEFDKAGLAYERAIALDPLNTVLRRVRALHINAILGDYEGVKTAEAACRGCSSDDYYVYAMAAYIAARRGGTDDQVRESAKVFHEMTKQIEVRPREFSNSIHLEYYLGLSEPAFVEWLLGGDKPSEDSLAWAQDLSCVFCDIALAPMFAAVGLYDQAFMLLEQSISEQSAPLYYVINPIGRDAWPDDFRRDPRFHAFWQSKGLPEVASTLRGKGVTGGLPLERLDGPAQ
jgi:TolB-like protein